MSEQRLGIDVPDNEETRHGLRARIFFYQNGLGLQRSDVKFEVLHGCGGWTWAHYPYCGQCGQPLELSAEHVATINANVHPANRIGEARAPTRPFAPSTAPVNRHPPGSFNNPTGPAWAKRGPVPGFPQQFQQSPPLDPPADVQARGDQAAERQTGRGGLTGTAG